jgi:hypothetical protein
MKPVPMEWVAQPMTQDLASSIEVKEVPHEKMYGTIFFHLLYNHMHVYRYNQNPM